MESHLATEDTELIVPIEDMGSGEESIVISVNKDGIKFQVLDDEDNVLYQASDNFAEFCDYIEARDLYLDAAIQRHPASQPRLQSIDGGGKQ